MAKFAVGEIVIYIGKGMNFPKGLEVEITISPFSFAGLLGYGVHVPNYPCASIFSQKGEWFIKEESLRKKKPPANTNEKKFFRDLDKFTKENQPTIKEKLSCKLQ